MQKTFRLVIAKVGENLFDGDAVAAHLPGAEGDFTVLAQHEAFVSELRAGTARVQTAGGRKEEFIITRGVAEVSNGQVTVLL